MILPKCITATNVIHSFDILGYCEKVKEKKQPFLQTGETVCCSLKSITQKLVKRLKQGQPISEAKWGKLAAQTRETNDFFLPLPCAADVQ